MTTDSVTLFETAIGWCGIVWAEHGIVGVQMPEADQGKTRARLRRRFPEARDAAPSAEVQRAIDGITALLRGEARDLSGVALDMARVPAFNRRVYEVARTIPPGATLSYGEIAERLGDRLLARDVGQAMGQNPFAIIVPCHRVLAAGGKIGGFSANGGIMTKRRMLAIESVHASDGLPLFSRG
jgi:methylated-DNA-[protein]-cysteine S-methyltransferase